MHLFDYRSFHRCADLCMSAGVHTDMHTLSRCLISSSNMIDVIVNGFLCHADQQPCLEEEQKCICQAVATSAEAGAAEGALQCCPASGAPADPAGQSDVCLQHCQNRLRQEYHQVSIKPHRTVYTELCTRTQRYMCRRTE